ncbi:MAG: hypothetical protein HYZ58_00415 [Acidobacteria bacterium]|nr:hypothetical protein [Acidobacteriota bacterium]MBI3261595.1 hypothetical protein [Acidobacteriota bacterium]
MDTPVVVFSDVDDALLDGPRSRAAVIEADERLASEQIALVFCSSKTRAELEAVRQDWGIFHPFICENGAGVFVPQRYFPFDVPYAREVAGYQAIEYGRPYADVIDILHRAANRLGIEVLGFSDMSVEQVAFECQLSLLRARLAKLREYGELFRIIDGGSSARGRLRRALHAAHLACTNSGPYDYVGSPVDPGPGIGLLTALYRRAREALITIGVGSRKDDMTLLKQVDVPIAIESDSTWARPSPATRMPGARLAATAGIAGWLEELVGIVREARRRDRARRQPIVRRPNVMT